LFVISTLLESLITTVLIILSTGFPTLVIEPVLVHVNVWSFNNSLLEQSFSAFKGVPS
jgi:hypothetical protein